MAAPVRPRSPLWMVVLSLACEEPMHPYRMQTLIKQRGKDLVANVAQRNSVYQTIDALRRAGLIEIRETSREERRPERTIYGATPEGRRALRSWIRTALSAPAREFPEFPAALSTVLGVDGPDDLRGLLEARVAALEPRLEELEKPVPGVPRLFLIEEEYMASMVRAEMRWLRAIVADLRSGRLTFPTEAELRRISPEMGGPTDATIRQLKESQALSPSKRGSRGRAPKANRASERRRKTR